ncbi:hypothetical protein JTB14_024080 [Gonioctena quinquepunctata]|nr:hypothetical protein JTB14_024080 [Gonioctena quinquepunctata]
MDCNETVESDEDLKKQGADGKEEVEIKNYLKLEENDEPKTFEGAMKMRNRRKWIEVMEDGIESMRECQAWELVKCPGDKQIVDYADWAGDNRDRKSTSGFILKIFGIPITWSSRKQSTVYLSSSEAEYISVSEACRERQWRQLTMDSNEDIKKITEFEDNQSTLKMLDHECTTNHSKYIDLKFHYIGD